MPRALLLDLDDTLYDYAPARDAAETALFAALAGLGLADPAVAWRRARAAVKARAGDTAASHSRLLYLTELAHAAGRVDWVGRCLALDRVYWETFFGAARLREGARALVNGFRRRGGRVALVTDLTLAVQLRKLEALDLLDSIDALVTSEEVGADKPDPRAFLLAAARLDLPIADCVVLGDSSARDGEGARRLGIPFLHAPTSHGGGTPLPELARLLEAMP